MWIFQHLMQKYKPHGFGASDRDMWLKTYTFHGLTALLTAVFPVYAI